MIKSNQILFAISKVNDASVYEINM